MSKENFKLLNQWLLSLNLPKELEPVAHDIHIDDLTGKKADHKSTFFHAMDLFYDFIHLDFGYGLKDRYVPLLYFSLWCSDKISQSIKEPVWEDFDQVPPKICLIPRNYYLFREERESYRRPLDLELFEPFQKNCVVYYSCERSNDSLKTKCSYDRGIRIESFGNRV